MKFWFDCEFTGLRKDTTLISLGIVAENNAQFYAEFCDFNKYHVTGDPWFEENVFKNTMRVDSSGRFSKPESTYERAVKNFKGNLVVFGDRSHIKDLLIGWLQQHGAGVNEPAEFISDVCHYDMVLLIDLLSDGGLAFDIPSWISPQCYDINQDIAWIYNISSQKAFDMDREFVAKDLSEIYTLIDYPKEMKHNALWDAGIIQTIYREIYPKRNKFTEEEDEE